MYSSKYIARLKGQDFLSLEVVAQNNLIDFYIVVPEELSRMVEKQLTTFYPDVYIEYVSGYNIFTENAKVKGCYFRQEKHFMYPFKTYEELNSDPLNSLTNVFSKLDADEAAVLQIMIRPRRGGWQSKGRELAKDIMQSKSKSMLSMLNPLSWLGTMLNVFFRGPTQEYLGYDAEKQQYTERTTPLTDEQIKAIEQKNTQIGYEAVIRLLMSSPNEHQAVQQLGSMKAAFSQYASTVNNELTSTTYHSDKALAINYIYRNLKRNWTQRLLHFKHGPMILSAQELASLYHVPDIRYNLAPHIRWQNFKVSKAPENVPKDGILLGQNHYRGTKTEIRIKNEDRFRHFYVIGQTGTGKSSILQVMIRQDLQNGKGICIIDPHGSLVEDVIPFIPRERADDVILFNPGDTERPLGLNLLEAANSEERDWVALEAMNIMIKLFDEEVFGPRIQDYFRNGCLTLMEHPEGGALTDIVRLFTDDDYQKERVKYVKNPIVKSFWENQMAKTGAREKQEMIPYFAAKFGQFVTNGMMRNIIGQTKSAFDFNEVMSNNKILLMNLSKGETGEMNSKLLGLIIVAKMQMAAMRRQKLPKEQRKDFFLYIDEFQNYVTDSIESILSEARKYRLGLVVAHQYLAQLESGAAKKGGKQVSLKDAIFGNVGSIMSYKIGAQDAEFMAKEMAPVFSEQDLVNMDKYKGVLKLSIDTQPSRPFSFIPTNPYTEEGDHEAAEAYKQLSRLKYGRDKDFVEREIFRRLGAI
jgi:ribosomal silencing factor RsfS